MLNKRDKTTSEAVFSKLELSEEQKQQLHALLEDQSITGFTHRQIKDVIEPILGPATRMIGARQTKAYFLKNPLTTSLHASTNHGMIYLFRKLLEQNQSEFVPIMKNNQFSNPDYVNAEIYKLFNINRIDCELNQHIAKHYQSVIDKFKTGWPARVDMVYAERLKVLKKQIELDYKLQQEFISHLFQEGTLNFPKVIENFQKEWNARVDEIYAAENQTRSKEDINSDQIIQRQFLKELLPQKPINFDKAIQLFPQEWAQRIEKLYLENHRKISKEELSEEDTYREAFLKEVQAKTSLNFLDVIDQHRDEWDERVNGVFAVKSTPITKEATSIDPFYQERFFIDLLKEVTTDFFTANNNAYLDRYEAHLNTNYQWGTEDTLALLHTYVQGERTVRDAEGRFSQEYDTKISLSIFSNGVRKSGARKNNPDMILNNRNNVHWVSIVRPAQLVIQAEEELQQSTTQEVGDTTKAKVIVASEQDSLDPFADLFKFDDESVDFDEDNLDFASEFGGFGGEFGGLDGAPNGFNDQFDGLDDLAALALDATSKAQDAANQFVDATGQTQDATGQTQDAADQTQDATGQTQDAADQTQDAADQTQDAADQTQGVTDKAKNTNTHQIDDEASDQLPDAVDAIEQLKPITHEEKLKILKEFSFDTYLDKLQRKESLFKDKYPLASKEAGVIYQQLNKEKEQFIAENSTITPKEFADNCQEIIRKADKSELNNHRGIKKILNGILNALIFIANLFVLLGNTMGQYELIDSNRIKTNSIEDINKLSTSLNALKAMRGRSDVINQHEKQVKTDDYDNPVTPSSGN